MSTNIKEIHRGFTHVGGPLTIKTFRKWTSSIFDNQLVYLRSDGAIAPWIPMQRPLGVSYGAATLQTERTYQQWNYPVSVDPEAIYEVGIDTNVSEAVLRNQIGNYMTVTSENENASINGLSSMRCVFSSLTNSLTPESVVQIMGPTRRVQQGAAATNNRVLVKLVNTQLEPYVDAT